jgi:hypothetical protein
MPALDDFGFSLDDPGQTQQALESNYQQQYAHSDAQGRNFLMGQHGVDAAMGGNSRVRQQQSVAQQFQNIVGQTQDEYKDNEDPLELAGAINSRVLAAGLSPQLTEQAVGNLAKIQQAQKQQALLEAQTSNYNQMASDRSDAAKLQRATATLIPVSMTPGDFGIVQPTPAGSAIKMFGDDGTVDAAGIASAMQAARANDPDIQFMTPEQLYSGKMLASANNANARIEAAKLGLQGKLVALQQKLAGGQMTGREYTMTSRVVSAADLGSAAAANIMDLPTGSSLGIFGIGAAPGHSPLEATRDTLRNRLSPQEVQTYNAMTAGLARNLATIETSGLLPTGAFTDSMNSVMLRDGDTEETRLRKMAETRQIIERGIQATRNNPRLPIAVKDEIDASLSKLQTAIPFTQDDVTQLIRSKKGSKAPQTLGQLAAARGLNDYTTEGEVEAAAARGLIRPGDKIKVGGRAATYVAAGQP